GGHVGEGLALHALQAHHDVGHLNPGIVEVVLDLDFVPQETKTSDERVTQGGVAQMPDVSRLVGVDIGVFDDDLAVRNRLLEPAMHPQPDALMQTKCQAAAVDVKVQVTAAGNLRLPDSGDLSRGLRQFVRDISRRTLEFSTEVEGNGKSQLTQIDTGRESKVEFFVTDLIMIADVLKENLLHCSRE